MRFVPPNKHVEAENGTQSTDPITTEITFLERLAPQGKGYGSFYAASPTPVLVMYKICYCWKLTQSLARSLHSSSVFTLSLFTALLLLLIILLWLVLNCTQWPLVNEDLQDISMGNLQLLQLQASSRSTCPTNNVNVTISYCNCHHQLSSSVPVSPSLPPHYISMTISWRSRQQMKKNQVNCLPMHALCARLPSSGWHSASSD